MGRPSLKTQRTSEILDAFARCVARAGVEGATLEAIAGEAGMTRTLLRHYVGNRDDLVAALTDRIGDSFDNRTEALFRSLPAKNRVAALLNSLFGTSRAAGRAPETADFAVFQALVAASERYPDTARRLRDWAMAFDRQITTELRHEYRGCTPDAAAEVSFGIVSLCFNIDALDPLDLPGNYPATAGNAARRLVATLEGPPES